MSYILDALRKSDQQRQRGQTPTLQATTTAAAAAAQPGVLAYGLFAAILVGSGIVIGWWQPWQAPAPPTAAALPAAPPALAAAPATPPLNPYPPAAQMPPATTPAPAGIATETVLNSEAAAAAATTERPRSGAATVKKNRPAVTPSAAAKKPARSAAGNDQVAPAINELPPAIQQELTPLSVSVHAYSPRASERIVGINNKLLREGGSLPSGLTLEKITPEGMILSYKGYRFRHELAGSGAAPR
jgi:general secretion pathway protein B